MLISLFCPPIIYSYPTLVLHLSCLVSVFSASNEDMAAQEAGDQAEAEVRLDEVNNELEEKKVSMIMI